MADKTLVKSFEVVPLQIPSEWWRGWLDPENSPKAPVGRAANPEGIPCFSQRPSKEVFSFGGSGEFSSFSGVCLAAVMGNCVIGQIAWSLSPLPRKQGGVSESGILASGCVGGR